MVEAFLPHFLPTRGTLFWLCVPVTFRPTSAPSLTGMAPCLGTAPGSCLCRCPNSTCWSPNPGYVSIVHLLRDHGGHRPLSLTLYPNTRLKYKNLDHIGTKIKCKHYLGILGIGKTLRPQHKHWKLWRETEELCLKK